MNELKPGLSTEKTTKIAKEMVVDFLGEEGEVLSTPSMIMLMEHACRLIVKPYLGSDKESLGTVVNAKHLAAALLGADVTIKATLTGVEGRRLIFSVEAFSGEEKIGEAVHERFVVSREKFLAKLKGGL